MSTNELITDRDPSHFPTDKAALQALAQAAVNVELFTIPLYMVTLYSIQGMHEINAADQTFYRGRQWPGAATTANPSTANEKAFNIIFSVFIQEMLHLQLAANVAASMGVTPSFTSTILQTENFGWKCFGPDETVIPHIIDLHDTTTYDHVKVALGPLDHNRIDLLLAIEEPESQAIDRIKPRKRSKYEVTVPFPDWTPEKGEADLPLFGTIGRMYRAMVQYMSIRYSDGTSLFERVYTPGALQRDLFNTPSSGHPMPEYPGFPTFVPAASAAEGFSGALDIINAITDQGEGKGVSGGIRALVAGHPLLVHTRVEPQYRSSETALRYDYPSYDENGKPEPSADASARFRSDGADHYARFLEIKHGLLDDVLTWDRWHAARGPTPWEAKDLLTGEGENHSPIPSANDVAQALNRLVEKDRSSKGHPVLIELSQVAAGAIAGVTRVLDSYWKDATVGFPYPSMGGSGDRVSICWATLGQAPDLSLGIESPKSGVLYHACQGLDLSQPGVDVMPAVATFHTCKGSNGCKAQGGCGFVQATSGGGSCSSGGGGGSCGFTVKAATSGCGNPTVTLYSAPSDNWCASLGGCAVPISASQLYPTSGEMQIYNTTKPKDQNGDAPKVGTLAFSEGQPVYDVAWKAYLMVLEANGSTEVPKQPPPSDLRLAFPPST